MNILKHIFLIAIFFASCNKTVEKNDNNLLHKLPPKAKKIKIQWLTDKITKIEIDTNLSHHNGFDCDSVIGIDYVGFESGHSYYPINEKGEYINTINKKQKLNKNQFLKLNSILGNRKTYENPSIAFCYEPRLAFIYFKNNKVIGQTQICLGCSQLISTAETVVGESDGLINEKANQELNILRNELGFKGEHK